MMKSHCDRCDKLCDSHRTWLEDKDSPLDARGKPRDGLSQQNPIWHVHIGEDKDFCRSCRIAILEAHVRELKHDDPEFNARIASDNSVQVTQSKMCGHPMPIMVDDQSLLCTLQFGHAGEHRWSLMEMRGSKPWDKKCDGEHMPPQCPDRECWLIEAEDYRSGERGCS